MKIYAYGYYTKDNAAIACGLINCEYEETAWWKAKYKLAEYGNTDNNLWIMEAHDMESVSNWITRCEED